MPKANGTNGNGRDATTGRFLKGNPGGPGNPYARAVHKFRMALLQYGDEEDRRERLVAKLWDEALDGKPWAVKELLDRVFGKPTASVEIHDASAADALRDGLRSLLARPSVIAALEESSN